jgi:hypothetical protein
MAGPVSVRVQAMLLLLGAMLLFCLAWRQLSWVCSPLPLETSRPAGNVCQRSGGVGGNPGRNGRHQGPSRYRYFGALERCRHRLRGSDLPEAVRHRVMSASLIHTVDNAAFPQW